MDHDDITPRPPQTARGLACALAALALCGLWAAGQHFNQAVTQRSAITAQQRTPVFEAPAPIRPLVSQPSRAFTPPEPSVVNSSAELNARTRNAANDSRRWQSEPPAPARPLITQSVPTFTPSESSVVDATTELNTQTRNAAADFRGGQHWRAATPLQDALREFPKAGAEARQSALSYLGASLKMLGRSADAERALRAAIQIAPKTDEAQQGLKWLRRPANRAVETF